MSSKLNYQPVRNGNIAANASKTEASTNNNVGDLVDWLEKRDSFWNGAAGDMLLFTNNVTTAQPANTIRADWNNNVGYNYAFQKYTNGANVQELAKWRFNLTTSYTFSEGSLKNVRVGGSYCYSQKAALGYRWSYLNLNGKEVTPQFRADVSASKYKIWPHFGELREGHLLLQDHGNTVSFRNIKVRVLPAPVAAASSEAASP